MPEPDRALLQALTEGASKLGIPLSELQQDQLMTYLGLLQRWNKVINLTAVRKPEEMVGRHLIDSLSLLPVLQVLLENRENPTLLDMGSGAGLPGIPIAIVAPEISVTMIDSAARKTRFVQQTIAELDLNNARVIHGRVQDCTDVPFDCLTARAFATPADIINLSHHLCLPQGCYALMMGRVEDKLDQLPSGFELESIQPINLPGEQLDRNIAVCRRSGVGS